MTKAPGYVTAREALTLFMQGSTPRLNDADMAALVGLSRTGITKIRNDGRNPSLEAAAALENITGIPASAWQPATPEQGRVSPAWLKVAAPPAPVAKPTKSVRRTALPAVA